ncbi:MAG TPA: BREX system P-loop protein BrxC [Candidatus Saccharicenans sp.]|nr:BREX system P-loop protein BrxC [Candidatus Saccharicenans sp.]
MKNIRDIFARPIDRYIEEVIKVEQTNESQVRAEIEEYVVTDSIRDQFAEIYKEIAEGPAKPREGIGIWISGFFGSGKSAFAKILGYTVANRKVGNTTASVLFNAVAHDQRIKEFLDYINTRIPFDAVIFDVSMEHGVRFTDEKLTEIMYKALLRELGYAEDFDLAELEITLENDNQLQYFEEEFEREHKKTWKNRRQLGLAINEASTVLHKLNPDTFPTADSWALTVGKARADIDPNKLARRSFELCARRAPGKALIFIIDEVGQFVSRSVDKMLDLQAVVQAMGIEGRNRVERGQAVSPFWIVVTSQEKLNEVVTALDSKKVELARLQDRFRLTVDLKQTDITEVTAQRVLNKTPEAAGMLAKLFDNNQGRIKACCTLENSSRNLPITQKEFIRLYPYLPYQMELCIDIVAGLRAKRGAYRHIGGSNRTIIKQAQQMIINPKTNLGSEPIGALVTLDKLYELLEAGNLLPNEVSQEIARIAAQLNDNPLATKVAKAISLLESVKDLPRTAHNLAVVLHPAVEADPLGPAVGKVLAELEKAQFVKNTQEGYKLLTVQEKTWESERNSLEPKEKERNQIHRDLISEIFSDPKIRTHQFKSLRTFRLGITLDGIPIGQEGDILLHLQLAEAERFNEALKEVRQESLSKPMELFWVAPIKDEMRAAVTELFRSNEMVNRYDVIASQQSISLSPEQQACLAEEKNRRQQYTRRIRSLLTSVLESGQSFFNGVNYNAISLGSDLASMMRGLIELAVPALYPKLEIGTLPLTGVEIEKFLTAINLSGLPKVFYGDNPDMSLVIKQGDQYVPNLGCLLCREILDYLHKEHAYGNRITGKIIESHFEGIGYGWELESIRLGLAVLFRGGAVEISYQGRKYRDYTEPAARQVFQSNPAFRAASFAPREPLDLKVLAAAARMYEDLTGKDVNIEEGAIAQSFKSLVAEDQQKLVPLYARLSALKLPGADTVLNQLNWIEGILNSPPDECVKTLAFEGKEYAEGRRRAEKLIKAVTDENANIYQKALEILDNQWPLLKERSADETLESTVEKLNILLNSEDWFCHLDEIKIASQTLDTAYRHLYATKLEQRVKLYGEALDMIKGRPEWLAVSQNDEIPPDQKQSVLYPLTSRIVSDMDLPFGATVCRRAGASLSQIETEIDSVSAIVSQVMKRLIQLAAPKGGVEIVPVSRLFPSQIATEEELREFLAALEERLKKIIARGDTVILE